MLRIKKQHKNITDESHYMYWYEETPYNQSTVYMNNVTHILNYGNKYILLGKSPNVF